MPFINRSKARVSHNSNISGYPRRGKLLIIRWIFIGCWGIILYYVGNASWNIFQLIASGKAPVLNTVLAALVLPVPLVHLGVPFWVFLTFAIPFWPILVACLWAVRDVQLEDKFLKEQVISDAINEKVQKVPTGTLPSIGIDQFPKPMGPSFDVARLPLPEPFIGRKSDLQWLLERLRKGRGSITVLYGLPGIGKSVLAGKAIHQLFDEKRRFGDGIVVHRCQGANDASQVVQSVLARLDTYRTAPKVENLEEAARSLLKGKDVLIVLDNIESKLAQNIETVVTLLHGATLLLIARQRLLSISVPAEASCRVSELTPGEALDLFIQPFGRSNADLNHIQLAAAERIVRDLGFHALAVKLAGAFAANLNRDLEILANELQDSKQQIEMPEGEPRSVALVFAERTKELPPRTKRLFTALAAFPTQEFSRRAALALAKALDSTRAEFNLNLLVFRALVEAAPNETMPPESDRERLRIHPLLHAFASDNFAKWPQKDCEDAHRAVARYYADYTEKASDVTALSFDELNIIGALKWSHNHEENDLTVRLCTGMQQFWLSRQDMTNSQLYLPWGIEAATNVVTMTNMSKDRLAVVALELGRGRLQHQVGKIAEAEQIFKNNLAVCSAMGERQSEGEIRVSLGQIAQQRGLLNEAEKHYEEALTIVREVKNRQIEGVILGYRGDIAWRRGQLEAADRYYKQSLEIVYEVEDQHAEALNLTRLGKIAQESGQLRKAIDLYQKALTIAREAQDKRGEGHIFRYLGSAAQARGQLEQAEDYYQKALTVAREFGDRQGEGWTLGYIGSVAHDHRQLERAEDYLQEALKVMREVQDRCGEGWIQGSLGNLNRSRIYLVDAENHYREALKIAHETEDLINYARLARTFGSFLIELRHNRIEGCKFLNETVQCYAKIGLSAEEEARREGRRLGCQQ